MKAFQTMLVALFLCATLGLALPSHTAAAAASSSDSASGTQAATPASKSKKTSQATGTAKAKASRTAKAKGVKRATAKRAPAHPTSVVRARPYGGSERAEQTRTANLNRGSLQSVRAGVPFNPAAAAGKRRSAAAAQVAQSTLKASRVAVKKRVRRSTAKSPKASKPSKAPDKGTL